MILTKVHATLSKHICTRKVPFSEEQEVVPPTEGTFKWESAIIGVLKRAPDNEISIKKLRKKVNMHNRMNRGTELVNWDCEGHRAGQSGL